MYMSRAQSESLLSEVEPLELLLPVSEELLLPLSRDGPPPGADPAFSAGYKMWRLVRGMDRSNNKSDMPYCALFPYSGLHLVRYDPN